MSKQSFIPSADLLLKQYIRLAQQFTDAATPQENFLTTIGSDWRYERALQGIRLLAQHHLGHLVQSLIAWRQTVNEDIKKNFSQNNVVNVQGVCKRAAMEILFLEAASQVLDEFVPEFWRERHFQTFFESMQHVSFRWLLNSEEYVPHQELSLVRQHVVLVSTRIVGALSRIKLSDVCNTFVKKLEERVNARKDMGPRTDQSLLRSQALKLCTGMRSIVLSFDNDSQLEQSTRFLQKVHPLNYTAAVKKSQVHHVLCEMLTDILTPLVRRNQPHGCSGLSPALLADWYATVLRLKNEIGQWANKHNKHIMVGYPLVTVLVCLVDAQNYNPLVDSMADFLAKQMKNKDYRSLCFKCLSQLVISSLVRNATPSCSPQLTTWLDKIVKPGLVNARKGGISMQEQQDFVADMADLNPEYCVGSIILDLLQSDSADAQLIALRTLHLVATSVPRDSAAAVDVQASMPRRSMGLSVSSSSSGNSGSTSKRMVQLPAVQILDLIRNGQHPFELQGIVHLLPRLQHQLGLLMTQYHRNYGNFLTFTGEMVPKDKQAALGLFSWVVRLVPYLRPEQWTTTKPLDLLPSYTAHVEGSMRQSSFDALMCTICACPALRGTVLSNMAAFIGAIPDEATLTIQECLMLLRKLMEAWLRLLQEQRLASSALDPLIGASNNSNSVEQQEQQQSMTSKDATGQLFSRSSREAAAVATAKATSVAAASAVGSSLTLDVHRLEGVLFMLLCSYDEKVRLDSFGILGLTRLLHQELHSIAEQRGIRIGTGPLQQQQQQAAPDAPLQLPTTLSAAATAVAGSLAAGGGSFTSTSSSNAAPVAQDSSCTAAAGGVPGNSSSSLQLAASGNSVSAGGFFFKHKPTMSRDSFEFMQTLGQLETPDAGVTYIMDVIEEAGDDVARRCFWDFGDWSDLWRETKHVPLDVSLQAVMAANDEVGGLRWMRCIVELACSACHMCPTSMGVAYMEMLHKLSRYLTRDSSGRLLIPTDSADGRRSDAWKSFVVVACACPPSLWERVEKAAARKGAGLTARELIRALLSSLTAGSAMPQQVCLMALGHASPEHYSVLFEELPALIDEYQRPSKPKRGTARPEEARKVVANIMRLVADSMAPGTLAAQPLIRARFLDWMRDTTLYMRGLAPFGEAFWEVSQVAYCLCAVCRCIAGQLVGPLTLPLALMRDSSAAVQRNSSSKSTASEASTGPGGVAAAGDTSQHGAASTAGQPMARKLLFEMFGTWCEEGAGRGGEHHSRLSGGINAALARAKDYDSDTKESLRQELIQSAELLDQASRLAMAAVLQGPVFDTDARRTQGPVLSWIDRLLQAPPLGITAGRVPAVPKDSVGRSALFNLLRSNLDMFSVCVDRCYDRDHRIATGSFQVLSEVYALNPVKVEPHVVLSLVLYKMVDSSPEVREDALHMLHVLSTREWQASPADMAAAVAAGVAGAAGGWTAQEQQQQESFALEAEGGSGTVVVLGALQDSYQQFQYQLAVKLARDHPELSEALCEEMMTRQLELADKVSQHPVLTCLGPWMENLTIAAHWKGTWCERLLKSMYYVTLRHGDELPLEIERLWSTLAGNRRNIIPILDFLASLGTHMAYQELASMLEYLGVSKRICLYLARISPQQTIDHLVYEISLQLHEEEGATSSTGGQGSLAPAQLMEACQAPLMQFADVLAYDTTGSSTTRPVTVQAAADPTGNLRSSASSWWAYSSTSSLTSSLAAAQVAGSSSSFPSNTLPGSSYPGAVGGCGSSVAGGIASSFAGLTAASSILSGIGLGSSYPPGPNASTSCTNMASQPSPASSTEPSMTSRGMRLSSTFTAVFGMGGSAVQPVPGAGTGAPTGSFTEFSESTMPGNSGLAGAVGGASLAVQVGAAAAQRAGTEQSDSTRSSLSISGPGTTGAAVAADSSTQGASAGLVPANTAAAAAGSGVAAAALQQQSAAGAGSGAASSSTFNLGSYYATSLRSGMQEQGSGMMSEDGAWGTAGQGGSGVGFRGRRSSRQAPREPPSPILRGLVTRPELALCLLTEVAYEHDEDFSSHLALLCHVSLLLVDHEEPLVAAAAQQLLINCLYSLSARHLEAMQEEGQQVQCLQATHLIKYLQSMKGRRLWSYEDLLLGQQQQLPSAAALANLVYHCLDALAFEAGLNEAWCGVALEWALHAHNRHLACRSQQVVRALRPPLTADMCSTLLVCLQQCLAAAHGSHIAREVALELLLTMRSLLEVLPARKLLLYPQVFWSAMLLLFTSYVHIYQQALLLLSACLKQLPMHDNTTQNVLLASAPAGDHNELQQLLARTQLACSWVDTSKSVCKVAAAEIDAGQPASSWGNSKGRKHGHMRERCFGNSAAAALVSSSVQSFIGGVDPDNGRPMPWAVGQLLPWPERGSDGPAHQMIALQQVLFKGLLFRDTQLPTVQLFTLLARGLCQLQPSAAGSPRQAPAAAGFDGDQDGAWNRDQGVAGMHRPITPTSASSSRTGSRATTDTPLHSSSRESPAVLAGGVLSAAEISRHRGAGRFGAMSLQQEQLLAQVASGQRHQQRSVQQLSPLEAAAQQQQQQLDPSSVSRSAPELRGVGTAAGASHDRTMSSGGMNTSSPKLQDSGGSRLVAGTIEQQQQRSSSKRQQQPTAAAMPGLSSSWGVWSSLMTGGTSTGTAKKLPGSRAVSQSLLGHRHSQLLVSIAAVVPFFCSQLGQLEPDSELLDALQECVLTLSAACSTQGLGELGSKLQLFTTSQTINAGLSSNSRHGQQKQSSAVSKQPEQQGRQSVNSSSSSSSGAKGLKQKAAGGAAGGFVNSSNNPPGGLGFATDRAASPRHLALLRLMQGLCLQLSRALLPTYADWLLRFWMGVLLLPGAAALHPHVLLLLRCLFDTPGLQLGPGVLLLLDGTFLSPIVSLSQGPLCQYALDALDAIIHFATNSQELQQYQQQHGIIAGALSSSVGSAALGAGVSAVQTSAAGNGAAAVQGVDLHSLAACLLPQLDVVGLLQRVLSSCAAPAKRRKYKLLPFLNDVMMVSQQQTEQDEC